MRCHHVTEPDGQRYWIPGCWGGIYGPEGCYCYHEREKPPRDERDRTIRELEKENARLNRLLYKILNQKR